MPRWKRIPKEPCCFCIDTVCQPVWQGSEVFLSVFVTKTSHFSLNSLMFRCVAFLRVFLFLKGVCSGVDSYTGKAPDAHTFFFTNSRFSFVVVPRFWFLFPVLFSLCIVAKRCLICVALFFLAKRNIVIIIAVPLDSVAWVRCAEHSHPIHE